MLVTSKKGNNLISENILSKYTSSQPRYAAFPQRKKYLFRPVIAYLQGAWKKYKTASKNDFPREA